MRYSGTRHKLEVGATKRKKIRTVDFCNALADILQQAKREQARNSLKYGALYRLNYCKEVKEKNRTYYEVYMLPRTEATPETDKCLSFVCLRPDGAIESPSTVGLMCRRAKGKVPGLEDFHFHMLRHPNVKPKTQNKIHYNTFLVNRNGFYSYLTTDFGR